MVNEKLFDRMRDAVGKLSCVAIHGQQYADGSGIDIAEECSFLIAAIEKIENNACDDCSETFEMMTSTCEAIRALADAYGGDSHFNNCVLMALRSCIAALEGLNK